MRNTTPQEILRLAAGHERDANKARDRRDQVGLRVHSRMAYHLRAQAADLYREMAKREIRG